MSEHGNAGEEQSPPGTRDVWIAYGGDPEEYDQMVEWYLNPGSQQEKDDE